jgi:adenosylhomocysteine nucleosidase
VGTARAGAVCREALASRSFDLVVSSGFACALTPSRIGDLLVGTDVIMLQNTPPFAQAEAVFCGERPRAVAIQAARDAGLALHEGRFVTLSQILWRAEEKRRVAEATGAVGLDMESAALGSAAAERQVPFAVVRAASDLLDEDLPLDFNLFLSQSGSIGVMGWLRGAGQCLTRPSRLVGLNRLRRQSTVASERMTRFFERFLDEFE